MLIRVMFCHSIGQAIKALQKTFFFALLAVCFLSNSCLYSSDNSFCRLGGESNLMEDLLVVDYWNKRINEKLPVTYNHLLQGGYFNMPSARMGEEGEISFGYSHVPPYRNYNLRFQLTDRLEISGNYRIFSGIEDPVLGQFGFGEFSDKGANVKFALLTAEDSQYRLPGIAIGFEDFMGTRAFNAQYIVFTQVFLKYHLEASLGYGGGRIRGLFGGLTWLPFRPSCYEYLRDLAFVVEYDAIPYKDHDIEKHPKGRVKKCPINFGLKYRFWNSFDFSISYIRGDALALSASTYFNFGSVKGVVPKIQDPLPYRSPVNNQEIGYLRPVDVMTQDLICAFREQGFEIFEMWIGYNQCCQKTLRIRLMNLVYREERFVRDRLNALLAFLVPDDIDQVEIVIDAESLPIQEYHYDMRYVRGFKEQEIGGYELKILTPMTEAYTPDYFNFEQIYLRKRELWNLEILPKTHTLFGSSRGKFKYALGISTSLNGYFYGDVYYTACLGYFFLSNLYDISDADRLNPSQLINVRTDIINYYKQKSITIDEAYLQKIWNLGKGWYLKGTIGLFEQMYGGIATECLYYPVHSCWAFGLESAIVRKRLTTGIGFTDRIRKLDGFRPTYRKFCGTQYFANVYYDCKCLAVEFKVSAGKFLANDYGVRTEVTRYFPSGLRLAFWYTYTNALDKINGEIYHDKGVYLVMPLDIFYTKSSRSKWGYGMSAWLRDVGAKAFTGTELYYLINEQRQ